MAASMRAAKQRIVPRRRVMIHQVFAEPGVAAALTVHEDLGTQAPHAHISAT